MRIVALINPNTDPAVTRRMVLAAAESAAAFDLDVVGITAERGARLITTEAELAAAAVAVEALLPRLSNAEAAIVSAFGDPGLERLRARCRCPVVGIGECALREAAAGGRRFAVATTTPALVDSIERAVARLGLGGNFAGVALTRGEARRVTDDPARLLAELQAAVERLTAAGDVQAVVIGGGPLATAARRLAMASPFAIVEPVPAAVRHVGGMLAALPTQAPGEPT